MSTVTMVQVVGKVLPHVIERNLASSGGQQAGGQAETPVANWKLFVRAPTGYGKTLVYQPLPVADKEILKLNVCKLAQDTCGCSCGYSNIFLLFPYSLSTNHKMHQLKPSSNHQNNPLSDPTEPLLFMHRTPWILICDVWHLYFLLETTFPPLQRDCLKSVGAVLVGHHTLHHIYG